MMQKSDKELCDFFKSSNPEVYQVLPENTKFLQDFY